MEILGPEKGSQIGPKMAPKKVGKKDTLKSEIFPFFFNKFNENIVFYTGKWAPCADFLMFYNEFARPKGQENRGECGQNSRKTIIFVFFLVLAWERRCGDFGRSKAPTWGPKRGPKAMRIGY